MKQSMGEIVQQSFYNFWPHGWTISFILESSHCVISAWYLEKRILIDAFSCAPNIQGEHIYQAMAELFKANNRGVVLEQIRE